MFEVEDRVRFETKVGMVSYVNIKTRTCVVQFRDGSHRTRPWHDLVLIEHSAKPDVLDLLKAGKYDQARQLYQEKCAEWWSQSDYEETRYRIEFKNTEDGIPRSNSLAELDTLYRSKPDFVDMPMAEFAECKLPKIRQLLDMDMDIEQSRALAQPWSRLLIQARAGAGKTRTIAARAVLAIRDEGLDPNQVMILAFNKAAAQEVGDRVRNLLDTSRYRNARTFHSLAHRLMQPREELLLNDGDEPSVREQSQFMQRLMERIMNPAFKELMFQFFRKELAEIEHLGRDLSPEDYFSFRRSLEHIALNGDRVKSQGEKYIADFLFEHDIKYSYERIWDWKTKFESRPYRPDFSILSNGKTIFLSIGP